MVGHELKHERPAPTSLDSAVVGVPVSHNYGTLESKAFEASDVYNGFCEQLRLGVSALGWKEVRRERALT